MLDLQSDSSCRFLQMAENGEKVNCALPSDTVPEQVTLDMAVELLKGPEILGAHPETGMDILLRSGKYGPYYQHGSLQVSAGKLQGEEPTLEAALLRLELKAKRHGVMLPLYKGWHSTVMQEL